MKKFCLFFVILLLGILFSNTALGATRPSPVIFKADLTKFNLPDGNWMLSFVPAKNLGQKEAEITKNFEQLKSDYLEIKKNCGNRKPPAGDINQYDDCTIGPGRLWYGGLTLQGDERKTINYWLYVGVKSNEMGRLFYPFSCTISSNFCEVGLSLGEPSRRLFLNDKFFVVLERLGSEKEIYFSDALNINWGALADPDWLTYFDSSDGKEFELKIDNLRITDKNKLEIQFKNSGFVFGVMSWVRSLRDYFLVSISSFFNNHDGRV